MAATTKNARRRLRQEELRDKFKAVEYIRQLELCYKQYEDTLEDLLKAKTRKSKLSRLDRQEMQDVIMQIDVLNARLPVIKAKVDLNLRRLKFVLPELRSVELTDPLGNNPLGSLADALREAVGGSGD